ncbi:MAG: hypothetical protein HYW57_07900 [Ignavibacteriales bacterium]|nr:hypothetical protein [Ignavibacteriales bacterium]
MKMGHTAIFLGTILILSTAFGQEKGVRQNPELSELAIELQNVRAALDSLKNDRSTKAAVADDDIEALEERLERRFAELENKLAALARSMSGVVFNPRTTAFINFAARADSRSVMDEEGVAEIDNRPFLRSLEIDLRAPVDPYADAVAIFAVEDEASQGFAVDPEEVYGIIKRVPFLESAPLGLKLKFGKFRAPFGINNRLHLHDLPWTTRPLVVSKFLGTEHGEFFESGFSPVGVDLDFFLPSPIPGTTLEANLDVVRSGGLGLSGGAVGKQPALLGRLNMSADWYNEHLLVFGASAYTERRKASGTLIGIDGTYKWSPSEQRASRSFVIGGEFFFGEKLVEDSLGEILTIRPNGWYAYAQAQLSYWLYLGARFDWVTEPAADLTISRSIGFYASYYTTEFLRLRFGFERRTGSSNGLNTVLFEVNFVFGSHPTEPYWVNR